MTMTRTRFRWPYIALILVAAACMSYVGTGRLVIDTDITGSLPVNDPIIADARYVMTHHPVKDRVVIDMGSRRPDIATLVDAAALVEKKLSASGLFAVVGMEEYQGLFPSLIAHVTENMPSLFTGEELEKKVRPMLEPAAVREALAENFSQLMDLEGIGRSRMMADDPLGLKNIILARLAHLAPSSGIQLSRGHLISSDGKHVLIMAEPKGSATDTAIARRIASVITAAAAEIDRVYSPRGVKLVVTPVGAYRAALDNEETAKKDTRIAVMVATIGIAILLLVGFPRPYVGILALLPAVLGTIAAAFVYSLFSRSISILAIGFGSTIISFTVDYGIAYLLFLDRPYETYGFDASREVWGLGLLAMLTTAVSFAFLFISGFTALAQIGYFAALGVLFTFIFVHLLFPVVFPTMPAARRGGFLPMQTFVDRILSSGSRLRPVVALLISGIMLAFARPDFRVDLASMNTVSVETIAAEKLVSDIWGNVFSRIYLMTESRSVDGLQAAGDRLAADLREEIAAGRLSAAFVPSMIFPGPEMIARNLLSWRQFWTADRVSALKKNIRAASKEIGFAPGAFDPFFAALAVKNVRPREIPERYYPLLGIHQLREGRWAQFSVLTPGKSYRGDKFYSRINESGLAKLFDPGLFTERLGAILLSGFIKMAAIVGGVTLLVALLYLLDLKMTLVAIAPTLFALVSTLGSMRLLGYRPGISTIIVTVIVIGMGTDYALYIVRAYQRYLDESHPSVGLIRMTVFLSACSTMIGFGVLSLAEHAMLRNAGLTLLLGIGYSFLGTVLIVPPLAARLMKVGDLPDEEFTPASDRHEARVRWRYRNMEPYPRFFARFKMKYDPMFRELHRLIPSANIILDVGTGYGVPGVWLLELFPGSRLYGIEPDIRRGRVAARAMGERGSVVRGRAPDLPDIPGEADVALAIDMIHYLDDPDLERLCAGIRGKISAKGIMIVRGTIPAQRRLTILRLIERIWVRINGLSTYYRPADRIMEIMRRAGFEVTQADSPEIDREELWFIGRPRPAKRKSGPRSGRGKK